MTVYTIDPRRTALLVIDVQKEYFKKGGPAYLPAARNVLGNIQKLIEAARGAKALIVYAQHMNRADGSDAGRMADFSDPNGAASFVEGSPEVELVDELSPRPGEVVFRKRRYSCFLNTELECVLHTRDVDTIVIAGYMTSFCCETTARDAHGRDYRVLFVRDANEGPDLAGPDGKVINHAMVLKNTLTALGNGIAEIVSSDEVAERLGKGQQKLDEAPTPRQAEAEQTASLSRAPAPGRGRQH